jgi:1-acyl-sn-glycerol-3-phosphate acyltransferase
LNPYYWVCYNLIKLLGRIFFRLRVVHRDRMINHGPVILAANHQSFLDPPLAGSVSDRAIFFLARKSLLDGPVLGWLLPKLNVIPVDSEGGRDRTALKALIRILRAGEGTLVFPEGARTLDGDLQPAQPGLGLVIAKTLAPVVPMRIFGAYDAWSIHDKWPRPGRVTIVVGEPIYFTAEDLEGGGKDLYQRLSQRVMDSIAALSLN